MSKKKKPGLVAIVLVPAILTLLVSVARLVGELMDWPDILVSRDGGLLGVTWLVPIFGFWFGMRACALGSRPNAAAAFAIALLGIGVAIGGVFAFLAMDLMFLPTDDNPGEFRGGVFFAIAVFAGTLVSLMGWLRAGLLLALYAVLARVPVIVITWIVYQAGWQGTHFLAAPPGRPADAPPVTADVLFYSNATAQLVVWIPFTIMIGMVFASIAAMLFGGKKR